MPPAHVGVVVANEVLDALPVERFAQRADGVKQVCVGPDGSDFVLLERPAPPYLLDAVAEIEADLGHALPVGYVSDVSPAAAGWTKDVAACLDRGMAFFFDYGVSRREYYAADRSSGWLRCHFRHHAHENALLLPGIQDITSWVDFSLVAEAAVDSDLEIAGFVTQSQFLLAGGLDQELESFSDLPLREQLQLSGQIKKLSLPGEMGENFKCLGVSRGMDMTPSAFSFADRTMTL